MALKKSHLGISLIEITVVISILAIVATFVMTKVLLSQKDTKRIAVFKETIGAIQEIAYKGFVEGKIVQGSNGSYVLNHLNALKICDTNSEAQGCWNSSLSDARTKQPGCILANGAVIAGLQDKPGGPGENNFRFYIDWNGQKGPNTLGDDLLKLRLYFFPSSNAGNLEPGDTTDTELYEEIFK
ncbi:MAG: type II secretion system protein [Cyanobacteria bacterium P01_H01_bin.74]